MGLQKLSSQILLLICFGVTVSGLIKLSNPSMLASVTQIQPGVPFLINCSADIVNLSAKFNIISRLQIHRMLPGWTKERVIADFNPYYIIAPSRNVSSIPTGRNWVVHFPKPVQPIGPATRNLSLGVEINDPVKADAGLYQCTVTHPSPGGAVDAFGYQNLTAKVSKSGSTGSKASGVMLLPALCLFLLTAVSAK
ncbi:hypothetical protein PoB_006004900 [Plakobranchus ocellatus]|uniref:Ig-like domain-containing protein n=1 Tax=Plakobranchus ocellatus TaxID=259542 RepID=A0AAV4CNV3_9GAST|nr:hypothetical protein PoB_006004900 [Plakobranchus ocellatus]